MDWGTHSNAGIMNTGGKTSQVSWNPSLLLQNQQARVTESNDGRRQLLRKRSPFELVRILETILHRLFVVVRFFNLYSYSSGPLTPTTCSSAITQIIAGKMTFDEANTKGLWMPFGYCNCTEKSN